MGDNGTKDVGYKTDLPEDLLDAALDAVDKRSTPNESASAEDLGIEIEVSEPAPAGSDDADDAGDTAQAADPAPDDDREEAGGDDEGGDDETEPEELSVSDLIAAGKVPPKVVEFLEAEQERARAAQERMLRALAETENVRRRLARQKDEAVKHANDGLLKELLPVLDNFELSLQHSDTENAERLREGVELILRQWYKVFEKIGAKPIEAAVGTSFDPSVHEAVMQDNDVDLPQGRISKILQTGFLYHERLLRPTMVAVSTGEGYAGTGEAAPEAASADAEAKSYPDPTLPDDAPVLKDDPDPPKAESGAGDDEDLPTVEMSEAELAAAAAADAGGETKPTKNESQAKTDAAKANDSELFQDDDLEDWEDAVDGVRTDGSE